MKLRLLVLLTVFAVACVGLTAGIVDLGSNDEKGGAAESSHVNDSNVPTKRAGGFSPYVDQDGNISQPKGYKQMWTHLGSWAVAKKPGEAIHEMHVVIDESIGNLSKLGLIEMAYIGIDCSLDTALHFNRNR